MKGFWGTSESYRYKSVGEFYCPGCRQTAGCLGVETVRVTRLFLLPIHRCAEDSGLVKCALCGGMFDRQVTAFSPAVSREGLKPALMTVLLLMMDTDAANGGTDLELAVVSRIVAEVTGDKMDPESIRLETRGLLSEKGALAEHLKSIAPYLTNAEKRMVLESAVQVAHADGYVSDEEAALIRLIGSLLEVPDSIYRRVTGDEYLAG